MKQSTTHVFPVSRLYENEINWANKIYLRQPIKGKWHEYTWSQTMDQARRLANFMKEQGIKPGDKVASLSKNCAQWFIMDFAIMILGAVSVPLYAMQTSNDIRFILTHSEAKLIFVGKLDNWQQQEQGIPAELPRVAMPYDTMPAEFSWNDIMSKYEPLKEVYQTKLDDIATILYTSGTTGTPKGVFFTYEILTAVNSIGEEDLEGQNLPSRLHLVSYLPLAHCYERAVIEMLSIGYESDVSFIESIDTFAENLRSIQPTIFASVPRIWSTFQQGILQKMPQEKLDKLLKIPGISYLVKHKIKKALGLSRAILCGSGSAPLPKSTIEWFEKLDIIISEGYGSTENFAYATSSSKDRRKVGAVGKIRLGAEAKIGENSELLIRSPGNMKGYYKEPELTKQILTEDGFLHTGDIASIDKDGYITILGRLKEQFKSAKGEFILPVPIENEFAKNTNIEQCCVIGTGLRQPFIVATLSQSAKSKNRESIEKDLQSTLNMINENLPNYSKLSHVMIAKGDWTSDNEMLTVTMKLKRRNIESKYITSVNDSIYTSERKILWAS